MSIDDRSKAVAADRPASRAAVEDKRRRRMGRPVGMTALATAATYVRTATTAVPPGRSR